MKKRLFKKGISPLIATVLLIAFAISIGVTIMSVGGNYYNTLKAGKSDCSKVLIGTFQLKDDEKCRAYEFEPIINFYTIGGLITTPLCYEEVGTGKGSLCLAPERLYNNTWTPIKTAIK